MLRFVKRVKTFLKYRVPHPILSLRLTLLGLPEDILYILLFIFKDNGVDFFQKVYLIMKLYLISFLINCPHKQSEIIQIIDSIISIPSSKNKYIIEAGSYKGGSTAKLSLACKIANKQLIVFDSFEGLPEDNEYQNEGIFRKNFYFYKEAYYGKLSEVKNNVKKFGNIEACSFIKGWFEKTMPRFNKDICLIFLDVDLVSSTKICLKFLYPLLIKGGVLFSHDGHIPNIIELFDDSQFWMNEVGYEKPYIIGLKKRRLIKIIKDQ